ncbi:MAG: helix-turn-helix protein [Firmicutes bacterium ADurb.Bin080]|jgi:antitoxin HigA-1|nr:helix-turn-helix transcriptional regulator [Clostridiales bacterium]OQC14329.1 MAG: helix-turn-helix protein [Firmicutes bacterium ADurb.Bin080]
MLINNLLDKNKMTKYKLAQLSGVPYSTLNDIFSGKSNITKCSAETIYQIAKTLNVSVELLIEDAIRTENRERSYEYGLPGYLQHDLDAYKDGLKNDSNLIDCLWGELYGSINIAEINDGAITPDHADYLRQKFLWRNI